ncbi:MAG: hypothetical protein EOO47_00025 [Flavobacterium sp.]|nr:MAG: hypothetical protein EOO47_00025 [Flavobacterium sp.]
MKNLTIDQQFELRALALKEVVKIVGLVSDAPDTIKINYLGKDYTLPVFKDRNGNWDVGFHNLVLK